MAEKKAPYQAGWVYQDEEFAAQYDYTRFEQDPKRQQRDLRTKQAILKALGRLDGVNRVLDMPCGTGRLAPLLIKAGYDYTGSDISQEMIDVGIEKVSEADRERFVQANAEELPFDDAAFDCVVCVRFLGRIPPGPRVRILRELHRVSRKYLLISTGYFGPGIARRDRLGARFPGLYPKGAKRAKRHAQLHEELAEARWEEAGWFAYKSRGFLSTTKHIGVYHKDERARKQQ